MKIKLIIISLALASFMLGCGGSEKGGEEDQTIAKDTHHHEAKAGEKLSLNDGQKWKVNEEMKPFIKAGENSLMTYMQNKGTDFKSLATDLKSSDNRLISSCTMDGRSHEELHLWLAPHLNLVSKLGKAGSPEEAEKVIGQLGHSFATFNQYFE